MRSLIERYLYSPLISSMEGGLSSVSTKKEGLSVCIIVRNEEKCILRCIQSVVDISDEIVVVDSGCTDNTVDIVREIKSGNIVLKYKGWNSNFSELRNFALECSGYSWVFFIDADEWVDGRAYRDLRYFLIMYGRCNDATVFCPRFLDSKNNKNYGVGRIFKNNGLIKYNGRVHEYPYSKNNIVNIPIKIDRNIRLLEINQIEDPYNIRWKFFLARDNFNYKKDVSFLIDFLDFFYSFNFPDTGYFKRAYIMLIFNFLEDGRVDKAIGLIERYDHFIDDKSINFYFVKKISLIKLSLGTVSLLDNVINESNKVKNSFLDNELYRFSSIKSEGRHLDEIIMFANELRDFFKFKFGF